MNFLKKIFGNDNKSISNIKKIIGTDKINDRLFIADNINNIIDVKDILINILIKNNLYYFYVLNKPILEDKYKYDYEDKVVVILSTNHKIIFLNLGSDDNLFQEYKEDFIEDVSAISNEYNFTNIIGRSRKWKDKLICETNDISELEKIISENEIYNEGEKRKVELIISLLIGSINDSEKIGKDLPKTKLDKIKRNIILFDAEQTRFIFNTKNKPVVKIQGLAGTGKTELLLHKLKDIYLNNNDVKIFFTCHNKILANDLRQRIPRFFDFMKVKKQIDWNNKIWVGNAWGTNNDFNSGLYSYLCNFYKIPFLRYNFLTGYKEIFKDLLDRIKDLKEQGNFKKAFDYILIDESQDFPEIFFKLCDEITNNQVYIAGDIFQNIFENDLEKRVTDVDFILNRCYRTEPKTLMFAHSIGMGLFEEKKFNWLLNKKEWEACGYIYEEKENNVILKREPIRRFEGININTPTTLINTQNTIDEIITIINKIKEDNTDLIAEDIAIIFIDDSKEIYEQIDLLSYKIVDKFGYLVNKGYETKNKQEKGIFISNANNVKGLEFPFIICISSEIKRSYKQRNKLYTMLTRSFLESYLIINFENEYFIKNKEGLNLINKEWYIKTKEPTAEELEDIRNTIIKVKESKNLNDLLEKYFTILKISDDCKKTIRNNAIEVFKNRDFNEEIIKSFINDNKKYC